MTFINLGFKVDLAYLMKTKLLIQSNSGGGKSYAIRKFVEETYGKTQIILIDIEGEFHTLREHFDFLLLGKEGDVPINVKSAEKLPEILIDNNISTIIDLFELTMNDRIQFVKKFCEAMIDLPKSKWKPVMIILDEIHMFAGQQEKQDSFLAVREQASRGRKRGQCLVGATQRIAKLHKDVAAELNNKMMGRTSLDVDMKRCAEELGFTSKQQQLSLRALDPGEFFVFGPAISKEVIKVRVGKVRTSHPEVGVSLDLPVTPPTEKVKRLISQIKDLPSEIEKESKDKKSLMEEVNKLKAHIRFLESAKQKPSDDLVKNYEKRMMIIQEASNKSVEGAIKKLEVEYSKKIHDSEDKLNKIRIILGQEKVKSSKIEGPKIEVPFVKVEHTFPQTSRWIRDPLQTPTTSSTSGMMRMLKSACMFYPNQITKAKMATLAGLSPNSGSFNTYISSLKTDGLLQVISPGEFIATKEGLEKAGDVEPLPTGAEKLVSLWANKIGGGAGRMLNELLSIYPESLSREDLGARVNMSSSSGSFNTYLSTLRSNGLIMPDGKNIKLHDSFFE